MSMNLIKYANAYPGRVTVLATVVLAVLYEFRRNTDGTSKQNGEHGGAI
ncbi:MAG TPA: hypothetical protein PLB89_05485 [Flavobacteriales bacterium]|nr:hypothetical protein [Flavobacteriales bacterium]